MTYIMADDIEVGKKKITYRSALIDIAMIINEPFLKIRFL